MLVLDNPNSQNTSASDRWTELGRNISTTIRTKAAASNYRDMAQLRGPDLANRIFRPSRVFAVKHMYSSYDDPVDIIGTKRGVSLQDVPDF